MAKIKMANLVNAIVELNPKELQELALGLAWCTTGISNKAEKLEFFLNVEVKEAKERFERMDALRDRLKEMA